MSVDEHHIEITEIVNQCCVDIGQNLIDIENQVSQIPTDSCTEPPSVEDIQDALPDLQDIQGAVDASMNNFDYGRLEGMGERVMNATRDAFNLEICLWAADLWPDSFPPHVPDPCHPNVRAAIDFSNFPTTNSIAQDLNTVNNHICISI